MKALKLRLTGQLLLPILGIVILGIALLQGFGYWESSNLLEEEITRSITRDRDAAVRAMDEWLVNQTANLKLWGLDDQFLRALEGDPEALRDVVALARNAKGSFAEMESVNIADATGQVLAGSEEDVQGTNVADRDYFKASMRGEIAVSAPLQSKSTGHAVIILSAPVKDGADKIHGILFIVANFNAIFKDVLAPIKIGQHGYAFITDREGMIFGHPNPDRVMKANISNLDYGKEILSNRTGIYKYFYPVGKQWKTMAYGTVEKTGWHVAVTAPARGIALPAGPHAQHEHPRRGDLAAGRGRRSLLGRQEDRVGHAGGGPDIREDR